MMQHEMQDIEAGAEQAPTTERDREWMRLRAASPLRGRSSQVDQAGLDLFDPPLL